MTRITVWRSLTAVLVTTVTLSAAAAPATPSGLNSEIINASGQLSIAVGNVNQFYREFNHGKAAAPFEVLDTETGNIPVLKVGYGMMLRYLYGQLSLSLADGDTDYKGYLQTLSPPITYTPLQDKTSNFMFDVTGRVGYPFRAGTRVVLVPYVEFSDHYWRRNLGGNSAYGYTEDYTHFTIGLGGKFLWNPAPRLVLEVGGGTGTTFLGNMSTGGEDFTLGDRPYWSAYTSADVRLASHWHMRASIEYRRWEYGASDADAIGIFEPDSTTKQTTFLVSGGYQF